MSLSQFKKMFLVAAMGFFVASNALADDDFLSICTSGWMKHMNDSAKPIDYKNFGEKYCDCASKQPLKGEDAIKKANQLCMSRTLLHDAMDSLEEEVGLSEAKDTNFMEYCQDRWNLVYPKLSAEDKKFTTDYCECAKPKLMTLISKADAFTDKEYDDQIDIVASACSGIVPANQSN